MCISKAKVDAAQRREARWKEGAAAAAAAEAVAAGGTEVKEVAADDSVAGAGADGEVEGTGSKTEEAAGGGRGKAASSRRSTRFRRAWSVVRFSDTTFGFLVSVLGSKFCVLLGGFGSLAYARRN